MTPCKSLGINYFVQPEQVNGRGSLEGSRLSNENNEEHQECQHHKEDLHDQPSIAGYAIQILEELSLGRIHIRQSLLYIFINAHCQLPLLLHLHNHTSIRHKCCNDTQALTEAVLVGEICR